MPTVEEIMAALVRLQEAAKDARQSVVAFVTAPGTEHPEGDAWFSIMETNLAAAHMNMGATIEALKDCNFERASLHVKMAQSLVFGCRYIAAHCVQTRSLYLPEEYNSFMRDANDTLSQLNGYMMAVAAHIEEKVPPKGT